MGAGTDNYLVSEGYQVVMLEDAADWTASAGAVADDAVHTKRGSKSVALTTPSGDWGTANRALVAGLGNADVITLWFYVADQSTFGSVRVRFSSQADFSTAYRYTAGPPRMFNGWYYLEIPKSAFINSGEASWANVAYMEIGASPETGTVSVVSFDSLYIDRKTRPKVQVQFDDGRASVYTEAFAAMAPLGLAGLVYVIPDMVGSAGYMTLAQLQELYDAGWDLCNHTYAHTVLGGKTQAEQETAVTDCYDWLVAQGFTRRDMGLHVAYPGGSWDLTTIDAMGAAGMLTGRTTQATWQSPLSVADERYALRARSLTYVTTLAQAKTWLDQAIEGGTSILFYGHDLVETPTDGEEFGIADFQGLMAYIASRSGSVDCVTLTEWYAGLTLS